MTAPKPAEGSAKVTPNKGSEVTPEGQKGKSLPLEKQTETAPMPDRAPPAGTGSRYQLPPAGDVIVGAQTNLSGAATVPQTAGEEKNSDGKKKNGKGEPRGKRYTSLQSVRKGLAQIANDLALGKIDKGPAAIRVQALQSIANVLALEEQARLDAQTAQVEAQLKAKGGPRA